MSTILRKVLILKSAFDGSKDVYRTIIDLGGNAAFYNNLLKIKNQLGSNVTKGLSKAKHKNALKSNTETKKA